MAEALGIASGIAGLLSLTIQIFSTTTNYVRGVHGASETVRGLIKELKDLKVALTALDDLVNESSDELFDTASSLLASLSLNDIKEYRDLLLDLQRNLEKRLTGKAALIKARALLWPFSEEGTQGIIAKLHRHLESFQFLASVDNWFVPITLQSTTYWS
jgi:hypothetical protein